MLNIDVSKVSSLLMSLYGSDIPVQQLDESLSADKHFVAGTYLDEAGAVKRLILCDCAFANRAGAALTMVPARTVDESIKNNDIEGNILENLGEILNISVNLLSESTSNHLVLGEVTKIAELESQMDFSDSTSFEVDIEKYGKGVLTVATVA